MVALGYVEVVDLPLKDGVIDYKLIQQTAQHAGYDENLFLLCSAIQHIYGLRLGCLKSSRTFPTDLGKSAKKLLKIQRQKFVPIMNWALVLGQNIEWDKCFKAFKINLHQCRINKFCEVNFKIFHRILATPVIILKVQKNPALACCGWCGAPANIDHILLECPQTNDLYEWAQDCLRIQVE